MLRCPVCNEATGKAYFSKSFACSKCHAALTSNVGSVTMWEGIIAIFVLWAPHWVLTRLFGDTWYVEWLLFWPLVVVAHFVILTALVEVTPSPR